ncbi:MAG TPA: Na+/H+ antiporter [Candidatus Baltobacteraceae bacterium]|nr:Na+/H+ antiporter [Candidatus Baltobacteraceae bacterium]
MSSGIAIDVAVMFLAMLVLVSAANRLRVPYPIALVLGGIALGYLPGLPALAMPPDLVLLIFLPPLLYWESVTAPTSEFFSSSGLWWMFQLAFGLVVVTMLAVGAAAHALVPAMAWGSALLLGAIVASTDEVALAPIIERMHIPRHVVATIEGESLVNDATSLVLYGIAVSAVVYNTFSLPHALGALALSITGALAIGVAAGLLASAAWRFTQRDDALQGVISLMVPYLAYLPAWYLGISGVLAVVAAGFTVSHFTPRVLTPRARERATGFWVTIVFMLNATIFMLVGMQFHQIAGSLHRFSFAQLALYGAAISATVIVVRLAWVFAQGLLPETNEPEHTAGKADWSHVAVLAWAGMRGGVSLAAALAIPIETATGLFPHRDLTIFLTFCVLIATLVGQGGTLPLLLRWLNIRDDGVDTREERVALTYTAKAALQRLGELERGEDGVSPGVARVIRQRFKTRWSEFAPSSYGAQDAARASNEYRRVVRSLLEVQRDSLAALRRAGKIDNTVMRRIQRLLDLEVEELDLLESTGQVDIEE